MLSVVIATKNEEQNIRACLESVKWADEIIVVDDVSTDKTVEICKEYTEKIFINNSGLDFHKNKNLGIEKAQGEWVLSIDADEIVTPELKEEIVLATTFQFPDIIGYYISRRNYFFKKWIKGCGWYPDYIIRLFRKGSATWPLEAIHQAPEIKDKNQVRFLTGPLLHYSYHSFNQYFEKFNHYTSIIAAEEYKKGTRINRLNFLSFFFIKPAYFILSKYLLQKGFKEGFSGFFISFSSALGVFVSYAKLWEQQRGLEDET